MGFKVKYKEITIPKFNQLLSDIYKNQAFDDVRTSYKIKRLVGHIEAAQKRFYQLYSDLQKEFVVEVIEKNAKGEDAKVKKINPEKKAEFSKKIEELGSIETEIPWHKLTLDDIQGLKITAFDLSHIAVILDDSDVLEEPLPSHTLPSASVPAIPTASLKS